MDEPTPNQPEIHTCATCSRFAAQALRGEIASYAWYCGQHEGEARWAARYGRPTLMFVIAGGGIYPSGQLTTRIQTSIVTGDATTVSHCVWAPGNCPRVSELDASIGAAPDWGGSKQSDGAVVQIFEGWGRASLLYHR
jgi:hypothetical protein